MSPWPAKSVPSSPFTASTIATRIWDAASLPTTRVPPSEPNVWSTESLMVVPSAWVRTSPTTHGWGMTPSPAIAAATIAICTGVAWTRP